MDGKDERVDAEAVLAHLDWVRGLAGRLVADANLADDVVQETWLATLRRGPRERSSLRAWLARVTRRAVLQENRSASIRRAHEQRAREAETEPSSAELVERASVQKLVVEAVLALDEPYRGTVLLRYFEGLAPKAIAERDGIPVSSVKTRLARALELLRRRLDRACGGDGRGWIRALAPLVPRSVWKGALAGGSWMVAMKTSVGVAAAAVVLVLGARELMRPAAEGRGEERRSQDLALREPEAPAAEPAAPVAAGSERRTALSVAELAEEGRLRVIVVNGETGERIPGAKLRYGPRRILEDFWHVFSVSEVPDMEAMLRASGSGGVCDAEGEWIAPSPERAEVFCARAGKLWAWGARPEEGELRLELIPDRTLTVEVVGTDGNPKVGVPVEIRSTTSQGGGGRAHGRTGERGRLLLAHVDSVLPDLRHGRRLEVELDVPSSSPVAWSMEPSEISDEPIRLVLPDSGKLVVDVHDRDGAAVAAWVLVTPLSRDPGDPGARVSGRRSGLRTLDGQAVFPFVALGTELLVKLQTDTRVEPEPQVIRGPTKPGETVSAAFEAGAPYPVLTAQVFGPEGELPGGTGISGEILVEGGGSDTALSCRSVVMGEGSLRIIVDTSVSLARFRSVHLQTEVPPRLSIDLPLHPQAADVLDLGKIVLEPAPVIAQGHVVDERGEPVFWAGIRLKRKVPYDNGRRFLWNPVGELATQSAEDGRFEVIGTLPPGEYRIFAMATGYIDTPMRTLEVGSHGLVFVLQREGRIAGSVRLDPGIDPRWLRVLVKPQGEEATAGERDHRRAVPSDRVLSDGSFLIAELPAGIAEVHLVLPGGDSPAAVLRDVVVSPGEETRDPRLQPLDLRGLVHRIDVVALDGTGRPIEAGHVGFDLGEGGVPHVLLEGGRASVLTTRRIVDATVFAPGYRTQQLSGVSGTSRVALAEGTPVRIRLPAGFRLPEEGIELRAALVPAASWRSRYEETVVSQNGEHELQWVQWIVGAASAFDETRELELASPGDGPMKVLWGLHVESKNPRSSPLSLPVAMSEEIDASSGGEVELAPEPDEYGRELEQIRDMRRGGRL